MKVYTIRKWEELFENNRSRKVKDLAWVPIPNRHDGENYAAIMAHDRASEIYAAWVLILQVASRCHTRGVLVKDNGTPHDALSLATKTRGRKEWFDVALEFISTETDWLDVKDFTPERHHGGSQVTLTAHHDATTMPPRCHPSDVDGAPEWQSGDEEGKGKKGMEGTEEKEDGSLDSDFESFWVQYPNKVGKPVAKKAYAKALKNYEPAQITNGLKSWLSSQSWAKDGGKFIPHPSTWLNQERFNDTPMDAKPAKQETINWIP